MPAGTALADGTGTIRAVHKITDMAGTGCRLCREEIGAGVRTTREAGQEAVRTNEPRAQLRGGGARVRIARPGAKAGPSVNAGDMHRWWIPAGHQVYTHAFTSNAHSPHQIRQITNLTRSDTKGVKPQAHERPDGIPALEAESAEPADVRPVP